MTYASLHRNSCIFLCLIRDIEEFWHDEIHIHLCSVDQGQDEKQPAEKSSGLKKYASY